MSTATAVPVPADVSSIGPGAGSPGNLPLQLTRFIGRAREVAEVRRLLAETRLLALTGAGGSGKTRLALEVAAQVAPEHRDGVLWIELAPLADPALVPSAVAAALQIVDQPGRSTAAALLEVLGRREMLLVLDNCEHLVEACASLADTLLRGCPALRILASSREALGVAGETAWLVPPLSLPDPRSPSPEALAESEAVQLFVVRARDVLPGFQLTEANAAAVSEICRRLDGIPLAIELAAARTRMLSPEQIRDRLGDAFRLLTAAARTALPRHRTLRAAIDWSYELLSEERKLVLQRLSVFAGGFTLEAAEAVCAGGAIAEFEVLDLIAGLVDRSLVTMQEQAGSARYGLLETLRQYAGERLQESGELEATRERHARYFLALIEEAEPQLQRDEEGWRQRVAAEHDNLRAALEWSLAAEQHPQIALRLVGVLWWFWVYHTHWREGLRWLEAALARSGDSAPAPVLAPALAPALARALCGAGSLAYLETSFPVSLTRLEQATALWRELGEAQQLALTLSIRAEVLTGVGQALAALPHAEEAVAIARTLPDRWVLGFALAHGLAFAAAGEGDFAAAERAYGEAEAIFREVDYPRGLAQALNGHAVVAWRAGDPARMAALSRASIEPIRRLGDPHSSTWPLFVLAVAAIQSGDPDRGARLFGACEARREETGAQLLPFQRMVHDPLVASTREALGEEAFARAWAEGCALKREEALAYAEEIPAGAEAGAPRRIAEPPPEPQPSPSPVPSPAPALRVLALGPLQIYRSGEPVQAESWGSAKPRELLLLLLMHPEGLTKDQVGLILWPDASPAQVRNNFHVILHRVRRALGGNEAVALEGERYRIALEHELDATLFEREAKQALRTLRSGGDGEQRLREALRLYRGDFLEGEVVGDWHLEWRDRLRQLFVEGALTLAERLEEAGESAEATTLYEQVIAREDLHEAAYRGVMRCRARRGERSQAMRLYQQLVALLRSELDTEPDEETTHLFERLQRGESG